MDRKSRYCPPHPTATASSAMESSSNEYSASIRPYKTKLELLDPLKSKMMIYRVCMLGGVSVLITEWQEAMRKYQKEIMRRSSENPFHVRDEHEEVLWNPCNEKELIADCERASDDMYYAADIQGWLGLRIGTRDLIANWVVRIAFTPACLAAGRAIFEKSTR